jgi:drug/metabolite transporter (DMT)-like permease
MRRFAISLGSYLSLNVFFRYHSIILFEAFNLLPMYSLGSNDLRATVTSSDLLLAIALAIFWGSTYPVIRIAGNPLVILLGRYVLASLVSLIGVLKIRSHMIKASRSNIFLGLLAGFFNTGSVVAMYYALEYIPSGPVSAIVYTYPLLMLVISSLIGFQRIEGRIVIGSMIAFGGVLLIYAPSNLNTLGVILSLTASILFAISSIISSRTSLDIASLTFTQNLSGLPIATVVYMIVDHETRIDLLTAAAIIHQGVGAGYIAYLAWYALIKRSIGIASSIVYMVPAAAYLIAIPVAGEIPEPHQVLGLLLILTSIYMARRI